MMPPRTVDFIFLILTTFYFCLSCVLSFCCIFYFMSSTSTLQVNQIHCIKTFGLRCGIVLHRYIIITDTDTDILVNKDPNQRKCRWLRPSTKPLLACKDSWFWNLPVQLLSYRYIGKCRLHGSCQAKGIISNLKRYSFALHSLSLITGTCYSKAISPCRLFIGLDPAAFPGLVTVALYRFH